MTQDQVQLGPDAERELRRYLKESRRFSQEAAEQRRQEHLYAVIYWTLMILVAVFLLTYIVKKYQDRLSPVLEEAS